MKIDVNAETKQFAIADINFTDLKTIRDACAAYGKEGSTHAAKIAADLADQMGNIAI